MPDILTARASTWTGAFGTAQKPRSGALRGERPTFHGVRKLLVRHGFSCQVPARWAVERDGDQVTGWVKETWPQGETSRRRSGHGSSSRTSPASRWRRLLPAPGPGADRRP
ncbi:winged helix-turn-helix domain-containing protein [Streptomyces sp. NPDC049627]|uniref:winged helix-turn-helix domain-containing protein n=1 Tax=Streptomyces sp. NPDC049627 TaxID=3365595 RepID=UPI0037ADEB32